MLEIEPILPAPKLATVEDIYLQMAKIYGRVIRCGDLIEDSLCNKEVILNQKAKTA